jgi:prolyl-tRNA synthetase
MKVSIRNLPLAQSGTAGRCVLTGRDATVDAVFAKAY